MLARSIVAAYIIEVCLGNLFGETNVADDDTNVAIYIIEVWLGSLFGETFVTIDDKVVATYIIEIWLGGLGHFCRPACRLHLIILVAQFD